MVSVPGGIVPFMSCEIGFLTIASTVPLGKCGPKERTLDLTPMSRIWTLPDLRELSGSLNPLNTRVFTGQTDKRKVGLPHSQAS